MNNPSIGFDDLEGDANVAQEIELSEEDVEGKEVQLRFVRFQRVNSLHVCISYIPSISVPQRLVDICRFESRRRG